MFRFIRPNFSKFYKKFSTNSNIITSSFNNIEIPNISIHEFVWKNLDKWPDKIAMSCIDTGRSYTYHQLHNKSLALTKFLKDSLRLQKQDTAAIILPNLPEYPLVLLGSLQAGLKVTTCNPNYTANEIKTQLNDSKAKIIFTHYDLVPIVRKSLENINWDVKIIAINHQNNSIPDGVIDLNEITTKEVGTPVIINTEDVAFLPYSSGTTGLPKGVALTQQSVISNLHQMNEDKIRLIQETTPEHQDSLPAFLPFFHIYGLVVVLLRSLYYGAKCVSIPKFGSEVFIKSLREHRANVIYGVPSTVIMSTNNENITVDDLKSVRAFVSGAAPLAASDIQRFKERTRGEIDILQAYGMTEASPVTLFQTKERCKEGASGILLPNTQARIIPVEEGQNRNLGPYEAGEILFKGPQIMKGYYNNPKASAEVLLEGGWYRSGDVGYYDEDGEFYITDRLKEFMKVKGFQVAPAELEAILREHPAVEDAAVVGVPHKLLGEAPKGFIVVKSGCTVDEKQIQEFVANKVSQHKHLVGGVEVINAIPKNPSGKILRRELRKL